jgi:hypothetical protein
VGLVQGFDYRTGLDDRVVVWQLEGAEGRLEVLTSCLEDWQRGRRALGGFDGSLGSIRAVKTGMGAFCCCRLSGGATVGEVGGRIGG